MMPVLFQLASNEIESIISLTSQIIFGLVCVLISLVSLGGNVLFCLVVLRTRSLITGANILLLCLSATDILISTTSMPVTAYNLFAGGMQLSSAACYTAGYTASLCAVATVFFMTTITINRYIRVCHSTVYDKCFTRGGIAVAIACVWLAAGFIVSPLVDGWNTVQYTPKTFVCAAVCEKQVYCVVQITIAYAIPFLVMVVCYGSIIQHFYFSRRELRRIEGQSPSKHTLRTPPDVNHVQRPKADACKTCWWRSKSATVIQVKEPRGVSSTILPVCERDEESYAHILLHQTTSQQSEGLDVLEDYLSPSSETESLSLSFLGYVSPRRMARESLQRYKETVMRKAREQQEEGNVHSIVNNLSQSLTPNNSAVKQTQLQRAQDEIQLVTTIFIIIAVFMLSYLPLIIIFFVNRKYEGLVPKEIRIATLLFWYANGMYNPIIYGVRNPHIRVGYKKLWSDLKTCCK